MFFSVSESISAIPPQGPSFNWGIAGLCWSHAASIAAQAAVSCLSRYRGYRSYTVANRGLRTLLGKLASENSSSANSGILPSLIRVFVIVTVISLHLFSLSFLSSFSSLTCKNLSFKMSSHSLNCTSLSFQLIFPNGWEHELAELEDIALHNELPTTFGNSELENKTKLGRTSWEEESDKTFELQNLLGDQELEKQLDHKPFLVDQLQTCPLDLLHDHLGQELLCENQLRAKHLRGIENDKKLENKELDKTNFQSLIYKKLVALLLEEALCFSNFFPASWLRSLGEVQRSFRRQL